MIMIKFTKDELWNLHANLSLQIFLNHSLPTDRWRVRKLRIFKKIIKAQNVHLPLIPVSLTLDQVKDLERLAEQRIHLFSQGDKLKAKSLIFWNQIYKKFRLALRRHS